MKLYQWYRIEKGERIPFYLTASGDDEAEWVAAQIFLLTGGRPEDFVLEEVILEPLHKDLVCPDIAREWFMAPPDLPEARAPRLGDEWELRKASAWPDRGRYHIAHNPRFDTGAIVLVGSGGNGGVHWYEDCRTPMEVMAKYLEEHSNPIE